MKAGQELTRVREVGCNCQVVVVSEPGGLGTELKAQQLVCLMALKFRHAFHFPVAFFTITSRAGSESYSSLHHSQCSLLEGI